MLNTFQQRTSQVGDSVVAASRQVWLAGLGAAVVTRGWAEKEAGSVLRNLVREGTAVESRAIRFVGAELLETGASGFRQHRRECWRLHRGLGRQFDRET